MNKIKDILIREKSVIIAFFVLFCLMFHLNHLYPLLSDDYEYSFTHLGNRVNSFHDILITQYNHYFTWGGRSVVHIIAQTLLWINKTCSDLLNTTAYVLLIFTMYRISKKGINKNSVSLIIIIAISMWFLQPSFNQTTLWITGSANYLWGCLIVLLFLSPYCSYYYGSSIKSNSNIKSLLFFIGGIIAGWTNENMALVLIFFIIVLLVLIKKDKKEIPIWAITGLLGVIVGVIFLFAAPGNYVRYEKLTKEMPSGILYYIERGKDMIIPFIKYGLIPSCIYSVLLFVFHKQKLHKTKTKALRLSILLYISSIVGIVVMIGSPFFPPRAWFGIITFAITSISILYANIGLYSNHLRVLNNIVLTLAILLFSISYFMGAKELQRIDNIFKERDKQITKQKEQGYEDIVLHGKFKTDRKPLLTINIPDFSDDPLKWNNRVYARYNGVKSIIILNDSLIQDQDSK